MERSTETDGRGGVEGRRGGIKSRRLEEECMCGGKRRENEEERESECEG